MTDQREVGGFKPLIGRAALTPAACAPILGILTKLLLIARKHSADSKED